MNVTWYTRGSSCKHKPALSSSSSSRHGPDIAICVILTHVDCLYCGPLQTALLWYIYHSANAWLEPTRSLCFNVTPHFQASVLLYVMVKLKVSKINLFHKGVTVIMNYTGTLFCGAFVAWTPLRHHYISSRHVMAPPSQILPDIRSWPM